MINLIPCDPPCHHNISCCMGFREHVFDLLTRPDIPVWYIMISHHLFLFICKSLSFSDSFHDLKWRFLFQSLIDQIYHDIISTTDCCGNNRISILDQCLRISKPYIGSMRQSRNTDKIRKALWMRILKHLNYKVCPKFRYSKWSKRCPINIFWCDP